MVIKCVFAIIHILSGCFATYLFSLIKKRKTEVQEMISKMGNVQNLVEEAHKKIEEMRLRIKKCPTHDSLKCLEDKIKRMLCNEEEK